MGDVAGRHGGGRHREPVHALEFPRPGEAGEESGSTADDVGVDGLATSGEPTGTAGGDVAIERILIQKEGSDLGSEDAEVAVGADESETIAAHRDSTVKGAKIKQN